MAIQQSVTNCGVAMIQDLHGPMQLHLFTIQASYTITMYFYFHKTFCVCFKMSNKLNRQKVKGNMP